MGKRGWSWVGAISFVGLAALVGCSSESPPTENEAGSISQAATVPVRFTVSAPAATPVAGTFISATSSLLVDDRVEASVTGKVVPIVALGATDTQLANGVKLHANVSSKPKVFLGGGQSVIDGFLKSGSTINAQAGSTVTGGKLENQLISSSDSTWDVAWPTTNGGNYILTSGPTTIPALAPGAYGQVALSSGRKIKLRTGTYYFDSISTEPQAEIQLDKADGPVFVYVKTTFSLKGPFKELNGARGQLLLGYAGTGTVYVEPAFLGTIVAPQGTIELRRPADNAAHEGAFFGKTVHVFSDCKVKFLPFDWSFLCPLGDTDGDNTNDCLDLCSTDPAKTAPGQCGCGVVDKDTDGDGTADCAEACGLDPKNVRPGQCGCAGRAGLKPAGTPCTDGACGGDGVCDGNGTCGGGTGCLPEPNCVLRPHKDSWYWFCPAATWDQAATRCGGVSGRRLVQIDDRDENDFVSSFVQSAAWTGANDRSVEGAWRWRGATNNDGTSFWQGTATGAPVNFGFSSWSSGKPTSTPDCGAVLAKSARGAWEDRDCAQALPYVCERSAFTTHGGPTVKPDWCHFFPHPICDKLNNDNDQPKDAPDCVPNDTVLPDTFAKFEQQVKDCKQNCTDPTQDCTALCVGAATVPLPTDRCDAFTDRHGCDMTDVVLTGPPCSADSQCTGGRVCRLHYECRRCDGNSGTCNSPSCPGVMRCGIPLANCAPADDPNERCGDVEICRDATTSFPSDPELDPDTNLTSTPTAPTPSMFVGTAQTPPKNTFPTDPAPCLASPCSDIRKENHPWCKYQVDGDLPQRDVADGKVAQSGGDGLIRFNFDPAMDLTYKATPLAFGLSRYDLSASASFLATVKLKLLSLQPEIEVVNAAAKVNANICRFSTAGTQLEVFGQDFLPAILGRSPAFDSDEVFDADECEKTVTKVEKIASRVKKAMRDSQELIRQYSALRTNGQDFAAGFCAQITKDLPLDFPTPGAPAINCATLSPRDTIKLFVTYYESQIKDLQQTLQKLPQQLLSMATLPEAWRSISLGGPNGEENQLLADVQFAIGPIPMKLEVEAILTYGIDGKIYFDFAPSALFTNDRQTVAKATAHAAPHAAAAVTVFLGVGFGVNGFNASAGVEGRVTLGDLAVPIWAGAGVDVQAEPDERGAGVPDDLASISDGVLFPPGGGKQYRYFMSYTYGASVEVKDILRGDLYGRVRIKFVFFSKTWRKNIAHFDGLGSKTYPLFQGGGSVSSAPVSWGVVRMPTPFPKLVLPSIPLGTLPPGAPATKAFDNARVEEFFYDNLCHCSKVDEPCDRKADCCDDVPNCFSDPGKGGQKVCSACRNAGQTCNNPSECCGTAPKCLVEPNSNGVGHCSSCKADGESCTLDDDCCGKGCVNNKCVSCLPRGEACSGRPADCCVKNPYSTQEMLCANTTSDPTFRCFCNMTGGGCYSSLECCDQECRDKDPITGLGTCSPEPPQ